jgi:dTDP-glucose pyrophosphorylase
VINILVPLGGQTPFFDVAEYPYPKPLVEISGVPMIELIIRNLSLLQADHRFIFVLRDEDCTRFHLDETVRLLTGVNLEILRIKGETKGAVCSSLLAVDYIDNDEPLIISNGDQIFESDLSDGVSALCARGVDGGCLVFESVHPRWSYVRLDDERRIVEAAEKRPISKNAIAGLYVFARGSDFVLGAKNAIRKDANVNGMYYTSSVFNELILMNRTLRAVPVPNDKYFTFYSPQKIAEYEATKHSRSREPREECNESFQAG